MVIIIIIILMIWVIIINLKFRLRQCFGLKVQDVKEFLALWLAKYVCSFWVLIENIFWQAAPFVRSHHFNLFTWCVYTHTRMHTPLFALTAKRKLLSESDWNLYQFFQAQAKNDLTAHYFDKFGARDREEMEERGRKAPHAPHNR